MPFFRVAILRIAFMLWVIQCASTGVQPPEVFALVVSTA
jgi:hypothetical protein